MDGIYFITKEVNHWNSWKWINDNKTVNSLIFIFASFKIKLKGERYINLKWKK